ncbi:MAG: glycosyltransferase family 4 protein [Anaerolineae bacterium]
MSPWTYLLVLGLSAGLTLILTPLAIRYGQRHHLVAEPGGRRAHRGSIVRAGGLPLYPAFLVATLATLWLPRSDPQEVIRLIGVLAGMTIVWVLGLLDDRYNLPGWAQLVGLACAALAAILCKVFIELFNNPLTGQQIQVDWYLMLPISLVWLVGIPGAVNWLDGLDGLVTGVIGIASFVLFAHMLRLGQFSVALLPLALLGCCAGFLPYNLSPARIFLGGGAYLLGFGLASISIVAGAKVATALLVLWVPILDMAWQMYSRWRRGQPIGLGDRGHLHFRLQDLGWPPRRIVGLYYLVTMLFGSTALLVSSRMLKLGLLLAVALVTIVGMAILARRTGDRTATGH